jgi:hypothetical protein
MTTKPNFSRKDRDGNDVCGTSRAEERKTCCNYVERVDDKKFACNNLVLGRFCRAEPEAAAKLAEAAGTVMRTFQEAVAKSRENKEKMERAGGGK